MLFAIDANCMNIVFNSGLWSVKSLTLVFLALHNHMTKKKQIKYSYTSEFSESSFHRKNYCGNPLIERLIEYRIILEL